MSSALVIGHHAVLQAVGQIEVVGHRQPGREKFSEDSKTHLGECAWDDFGRDQRAVDEVPLGAVVILVQVADGRKDDAAPDRQRRIDAKVDEGRL